MEKEYAPIALFCYNRPGHLGRTLKALQANHGIEQTRIYAYSDGPQSAEDVEPVKAVRAMLEAIDWCASVTVVPQEVNLGLRASIVSGVTRVVGEHGRVIVLEDDIVTSPWFLTYMNDALDTYAGVPKVMHIAGFLPPIDPSGLPEAFFYRHMNCWGWATWADRWRHLDMDGKTLLDRLDGEVGYRFNLDGAYDFRNHLELNVQGRITTWAIFWYCAIFFRGGQCLHPSVSLAENIGHDGSGTNCKGTDSFSNTLGQKRISNFPEQVEENGEALERVRQFYLANAGKV